MGCDFVINLVELTLKNTICIMNIKYASGLLITTELHWG